MIMSSVKNDVYSVPLIGGSSSSGNGITANTDAAVPQTDTKQTDVGNAAVQRTKNVAKAELENKVDVLNKFMQSINPDMQFAVHEKTQQLMVKFVDAKDNRVIKEFPAPAFLDMVADIGNYVGMLLDKKL